MRFSAFALSIALALSLSHGRSLASIRKDAFTVGVGKADSAAEYGFISEMNARLKFSRFRLVVFDNAVSGQKLLLEGKIDAIISRVNYFPHFDGKFLVSEPYGKTEIAVAALSRNDKIQTLSDLSGKRIAFVPRDVSNEQVLGIWKNSVPSAAQSLNDAVNFLKGGEADVVVAGRQSLESRKDSSLRIFPNKLLENGVVALFALDSKGLQEEFNKALKIGASSSSSASPPKPDGKEQKQGTRERLAKAMSLLNELRKEIELLQKELK